MIHHGSGGGVTGHVADGIAILDHIVPSLKGRKNNLVTPRNVHGKDNAFHNITFREVLKGDGNVVGRVYLNILHD